MEKYENDTFINFSIKNWRKFTLTPRGTIQSVTRGHFFFFFFFKPLLLGHMELSSHPICTLVAYGGN